MSSAAQLGPWRKRRRRLPRQCRPISAVRLPPRPPMHVDADHDQPSSSPANHHAPAAGAGAGAGAGPHPAPTFSVLKPIIEKEEDGPGPRGGHTITAVAAVGKEGSPGFVGPRHILFGGATALEGSSAAPPSSAGSPRIRLAGATADVRCYDVLAKKWSRLTPLGEPPSPRVSHATTAVSTTVMIQGGIGPAGLSVEDLHILDLRQQHPRWHRVVVRGPGPGRRYGHVMALVGQRLVLAIGGNDGKRPLADVWALDTAAKPFEWRKLEPEGMRLQVHGLMAFSCFVEGGMQTVCLCQVPIVLLNIGMGVGSGPLLLVSLHHLDTSMQLLLSMHDFMSLVGLSVVGTW